jgi:hypothetical protein
VKYKFLVPLLLISIGFSGCSFLKTVSEKISTTYKSIAHKPEKKESSTPPIGEIAKPSNKSTKPPVHHQQKANLDKSITQNTIKAQLVHPLREFRAASEPLIISFFQLGICRFIMIGYRIACPLPITGL